MTASAPDWLSRKEGTGRDQAMDAGCTYLLWRNRTKKRAVDRRASNHADHRATEETPLDLGKAPLKFQRPLSPS